MGRKKEEKKKPEKWGTNGNIWNNHQTLCYQVKYTNQNQLPFPSQGGIIRATYDKHYKNTFLAAYLTKYDLNRIFMFYTHKEFCTSEGVGPFTVMECLKHYLDCSTGYTDLSAIMQLCWYKEEGGQTNGKVLCAITKSTKKSYGLNMSLCKFIFKKL